MKRIIIEESSLKDWRFLAVFVEANGVRSYTYFNDPHELIKDIEKLKAQSNKQIELTSRTAAHVNL